MSAVIDSGGSYSLQFDTLRIFPSLTESIESTFSTGFNDGVYSYMLSGGCPGSILYIYDLVHPKQSLSIPLPDSADWCGRSALDFKSLNSFYLTTKQGLLYHYDSAVWRKISDLNSILQKEDVRVSPARQPFELYVQNDSILYTAVMRIHEKNKYSALNYNFPLTARVNVKTGRSKVIGMGTPKELSRRYPLIYNTFQHYYNGRIIYHFHAIPQWMIYDPGSDTLVIRKIRSRYQSREFRPIKKKNYDRDEAWSYMLRSGQYEKELLYDPLRELYYFFYRLPLPEKTVDGYFTTARDARISVMIIDKEFRVVGEELLPKECFFIFYSGVTTDGLVINYGPVIEPEKNGIKLLKISVVRR